MTNDERLKALQRMARYRVMRRMQTYSRMHPLVVEATKLSIKIGELRKDIGPEFNPFTPEFRRG